MTAPDETADLNERVKAEFRANAGTVGGRFDGKPMLIVHTVGAKSGRVREIPLVYLPDGDRMMVFASKGGSPTHPHWYHNLMANPDVTLEVGSETFAAHAEEIAGDERDAIYARQVAAIPDFGGYQEGNPRRIPVIAFTRA